MGMQGQSLRALVAQLEQIIAIIRTDGRPRGRILTAEMRVDLADTEGWGMTIKLSDAEDESSAGPAKDPK